MRRRPAQVVALATVAAFVFACGGPATTSRPTAPSAPRSSASSTPTPTPSSTPTPSTHPEGWRSLPSPPTSLGLVNVWTGQVVLASLRGCCQNMDGDVIYAFRPGARTWRAMPPYPHGPRVGSAFVWTGSELIQTGGAREMSDPNGPWMTEPTRDGMALNPATRQWRPIADSPRQVPTQIVFWTGDEAIFADSTRLLRYDPTSDRWATGAALPGVVRGQPTIVWTGQELVVWGGSVLVRGKRSDTEMSLRDGYAYRPGSDRWRPLPAAPIGAWGAAGVWDGGEVLVWGGTATRDQGAERFTQDQGAAYDPATNSWRQLPQAPVADYQGLVLAGAWTGREFVVYTGRGGGAAYRPRTDEWRRLPPGPTRWLGGMDAIWTERSLVLLPESYGRKVWEYFPGY